MDEPWYKKAIFYSVKVDVFMDADGDGIGDLQGLIARLDHLSALGVSCLWLLPIMDSPQKDAGFDVVDYYRIDPRIGTMGDFVELIRAADDHGIKIILDLVVNHTSDQHPWFQQARQSRDSKYFPWYVWRDDKPTAKEQDGEVFPGEQDGVWKYEPKVKAWFHHRFYDHQPDLNLFHPPVLEEVCRVMGFWLKLGVSGFRLDAAPFMIEEATAHQDVIDPHALLRDMRRAASWQRGDAVLLAEANLPPDEAPQFFDDGRGVNMMFDFWTNQHMWKALATGDARPLATALGERAQVHPESQWAVFLRNHDEVDLGRLSKADRTACFARFGPDPDMQLYGRGLRRRLAPMIGDRNQLDMVRSLGLSLPGTPVLFYGDEIGMGEDLTRAGRESVRLPMQWSAEDNGGFSRADPSVLEVKPLKDGPWGYAHVNVADQRRDPESTLQRTTRLVAARRELVEIGRGPCTIVDTGHSSVLALRWGDDKDGVLVLHNLKNQPVVVDCGHADIEAAGAFDVVANRLYPRGTDEGFELDGFGYRWLRIGHADRAVLQRSSEAASMMTSRADPTSSKPDGAKGAGSKKKTSTPSTTKKTSTKKKSSTSTKKKSSTSTKKKPQRKAGKTERPKASRKPR